MDYEAESSLNQLILSKIRLCSICSGKKKVSQIGFGGELIFQSISSEFGGSTLLKLHYLTDRRRFAQLMINHKKPAINVTFPAISSRKVLTSLSISVELCQGLNSIRIFNSNDDAPEFDRLQVY